MRGTYLTLIASLTLATATQTQAKSAIAFAQPSGGGPSAIVPGVLQCVPYARDISGIRLYGDAHTWWKQAEGKYARGRVPRPGAVLALRPHGNSTLGHVATVSRVVDARTILISHANWSAPGKIERNVTAIDVSPANDWSQVRVWFAPIQNLGGSHWPVAGFIYAAKPGKEPKIAKLAEVKPAKADKGVRLGAEPVKPKRPMRLAKVDPRKDPIGAILASAR